MDCITGLIWMGGDYMSKIGFKESRISEQHYFEWRKNRGKLCVNRVSHVMDLNNKTVLDIGCGYGALSSLLLDKGAYVYGTETNGSKLNVASKLINSDRFKLKHVDSETLPFEDNYFDAVFLFDVIEHVDNPEKMIDECYRVLKKSGILYVEFTPYYSITGHHLYDYAKWPIHILPKGKIKKIVFSKKVNSYLTPEYYWDQFESLNKLKIGKFQKMINGRFNKIEERFIVKYPELFEINLSFVNYFGALKDFFTMSYEGLFKKE